MRRLAAFRRLSAIERMAFLRALALLPAIGMGLKIGGLRRVQAFLDRREAMPQTANAPQRERARRTAWLVATAARHGPYRATCLPIALATQWLLARDGIATELMLGVRKVEGHLDAHAWLELGGATLGDAPDGEPFAAFAP